MKQFLKNIGIFTLFISIVFSTILSICEIQIPDYYVIQMTENTSYEKVAWNIKIIKNNHCRITNSSIFIGPSWLQGGINDSILNSYGFNSINMGVNHGGADLDYYFVSRIIRFKPRFIFLHRFPKGQELFHPMMPLLMSPLSYMSNFKNINSNYIPQRLFFVFKYLSYRFFNFNKVILRKEFEFSQYGWRPEGYSHIKLEKEKLKEMLIEKCLTNRMMRKVRFDSNGILIKSINSKETIQEWMATKYFHIGNGEQARNKAFLLCRKNKVRVAEIYIPYFLDAYYDKKYDLNQYYYQSTGLSKKCYHLQNVAFLSNQSFWYDLNHLNTQGSCLFTDSIYKILPK